MLRTIFILAIWTGLLFALMPAPDDRDGLMLNPDPLYCYGDRRYDALRDEEPDCAPDVVRETKDDGFWIRERHS